ncbi:septal ring lytic transglycosylase RlpA family protein [Rhodoplanes azumiensis]|uniref:Endolytic peptidoglycan transglycosylase RlpA n=1 Tax=Rhodoplanes azumiensis TaxID=1897628 RepID=A0ABW5API5_9BRAD
MGILGGAGLWVGLAGVVLPGAAATESADRTARTASRTTGPTATRVASATPSEGLPVVVPMPRPRPVTALAASAARSGGQASSPAPGPANSLDLQAGPAQTGPAQPGAAKPGFTLASLTPPDVPLPRARPAGDTGDPRCGGGKLVRSAYYWQGTKTASGQRFDPDGFTAAHRTLPFGTKLTVKNPRTGRAVEVVVNDRGPYTPGLHIDLSRGAARAIGLMGTGTVCLM